MQVKRAARTARKKKHALLKNLLSGNERETMALRHGFINRRIRPEQAAAEMEQVLEAKEPAGVVWRQNDDGTIYKKGDRKR